VRLLCTLEDVTEKLRAIERLHLVQTAIEAAPTGFVIANALGHIQWVNPAFTAMTGYTLEHVVGSTPGILKSGRQDSQFYDHLWKTISRGKTWEGDLQNQRRDGAIYWEHMIIAPVVRANGTIMHYVAIKQDITAQKDMETRSPAPSGSKASACSPAASRTI
jgi:PAS domain S-box-containing protein